MKFGVSLMHVNYKAAAAMAQHAEALGYESVWAGDHLIWPVQYAANYPYDPTGKPYVPIDVPTLDCWNYLTWIAAHTKTIGLGTGVYILPLRDPIVTARSVMTLDVLSGGRVLFGVGVGWLAEEFKFCGLDYHTRGKRMDECLDVIERLWTEDTPSFDGRFVRFDAVKFLPKPASRPRPPVLIGGESDAALRRAANYGDGWVDVPASPEKAAECVAKLKAYRADSPRAGQPLDITIMVDSAPPPAEIDRYREAGVTRLVVSPFKRTREAMAGLENYARQVMNA